MKILKMAEIDACDLFEDESVNWKYCMNFSTFHHASDDNCEFILYLSKDDEIFKETLDNMKEWKCSDEFINVCKEVRDKKLKFVLFYS